LAFCSTGKKEELKTHQRTHRAQREVSFGRKEGKLLMSLFLPQRKVRNEKREMKEFYINVIK